MEIYCVIVLCTIFGLLVDGNGENSVYSVRNYIYTRDELLLALRSRANSDIMRSLENVDNPKEIKRRKRGKSGGVKKRLKRQGHTPYLPSCHR